MSILLLDTITVHVQVKAGRDVVCLEWLQQCADLRKRVPVAPHQRLHLSNATRNATRPCQHWIALATRERKQPNI